eukprot:151924_1
MSANVFTNLFLYLCIHLAFGQQYMEILASSNACFSSTSYTSTIFNAPKNGKIHGITLRHISGSVNCNKNSYAASNFGCNNAIDTLMTIFLRVTDSDNYYGEEYYPAIDTQDINILTESSCSHGCNIKNYQISGYNANSDEITLIDPTYEVDITDRFMLQYAEVCCGSNKYNEGTSCAEVYFLYEMTTIPPTEEPTTSAPTFGPTFEPTVEKIYEFGYVNNNASCNNLYDNVYIEYDKGVEQCADLC